MRRKRVARAVPAALIGGTGFWLALGTVSPFGNGERLGVLASWWVLAPLVAAPLAAAAWCEEGRLRAHGWLIGALGFLPWIPLDGAPALLLWQGPLAILLLAAAVAVVVCPPRRPAWGDRIARMTPARQTMLAVLIAFVCYVAAAWRMAPALPGGDEPHYLMIAESLVHDGDLAIGNNHERHDYRAYMDHPLEPHYLRRGLDGSIYSIHAPGVAALVAPALAIGGYPWGVVGVLAFVAALGAGLVWRASWQLTGDAGAAWIGWASVGLTVPYFFQAFTVYPDGPGAVLVMIAVYGLMLIPPGVMEGKLEERPASAGDTAGPNCHGDPSRPARQRGLSRRIVAVSAAVALLPWLHTRFSVLAAALGVLLLVHVWQGCRSIARVVAAAAIPAASAALWLAWFYAIYGTPNPTAPYAGHANSSIANARRGINGLVIDQQFGLLPNALVYLAVMAGAWLVWRRRRRMAIELAVVVIPYVVVVASHLMWWGGHSSPARFLSPVVLPAGMLVAFAWRRSRPAARATMAALLAVSLATTAILAGVDRGALAYNSRDGYGLWLHWLAPVVRLPLAFPSLFRSGGALGDAWMQALAWALGVAGAWVVVRRAATATTRRRLPAVAAAAAALAVTIGSSLGWLLASRTAIDEGSGLWRVARAAGRPGATGVRLPGLHLSGAGTMMAGVPLPSPARRDGAERPLFVATDVPPGEYAVTGMSGRMGEGKIRAIIGHGPLPLATADLSGASDGGPMMMIDLPFGATTLTVRGNDGSTSRPGSVALTPVRLTHTRLPLARACVPRGGAILWQLDDDAWAEAGGLWTRGTDAATFAVDVAGPVPLRLRNGPVANELQLASGDWHVRLTLSPGEARDVNVPIASRLAPITIRASRAFRPVDYDPKTDDVRLLGVAVELRSARFLSAGL